MEIKKLVRYIPLGWKLEIISTNEYCEDPAVQTPLLKFTIISPDEKKDSFAYSEMVFSLMNAKFIEESLIENINNSIEKLK